MIVPVLFSWIVQTEYRETTSLVVGLLLTILVTVGLLIANALLKLTVQTEYLTTS